ncbi:hypothetical protein GCM10009039_03450 [Halocalculus aciditolerans]|uniref:SigmaK-factor processing regulatory protein BofA n=2 Tax=Halocalculus aciditolerans TaxID=1383812 RepID=A0A830FF06_9EURY|nr:hypothetical protein GCM10009039_03450 [Halocalculus aciditolerans]
MLEVVLLLVVLAALVGAYRVVNAVKPFVVNAVVGLVTLFVAQAVFGVDVAITPLTLLVVAIGGFPGALLVLLLSVSGVAFVPGLLAAGALA